MAVRTVFSMAEDCARGERQGWYEFVRDYGHIGRVLLEHYFPELQPRLEEHRTGVFARARAGDNAWFRSFRFANEREFLMNFRELVFAEGKEAVPAVAAEVSLDQMRQVMADLAVIERQILWLIVKGYPLERIAPIVVNAAATARAVKEKADAKLSSVLPGASGNAFSASVRGLTEAARATASEPCLPYKTFNNLVNGQITWRERELAEKHISECFNCLDRFTSFQEMVRFRKDAQPLPDAEIESLLKRLNVRAAGPAPRKKGILARLFSSS